MAHMNKSVLRGDDFKADSVVASRLIAEKGGTEPYRNAWWMGLVPCWKRSDTAISCPSAIGVLVTWKIAASLPAMTEWAGLGVRCGRGGC